MLEVTRNIYYNVLFPSRVVTFTFPSTSLLSLYVFFFFFSLSSSPSLRSLLIFCSLISSSSYFLLTALFSSSPTLFYFFYTFVFILFCFPTSSSAVFCRIQLLRRRIHIYNDFTHTSQINSAQQSATFRCFLDHLMALMQWQLSELRRKS